MRGAAVGRGTMNRLGRVVAREGVLQAHGGTSGLGADGNDVAHRGAGELRER